MVLAHSQKHRSCRDTRSTVRQAYKNALRSRVAYYFALYTCTRMIENTRKIQRRIRVYAVHTPPPSRYRYRFHGCDAGYIRRVRRLCTPGATTGSSPRGVVRARSALSARARAADIWREIFSLYLHARRAPRCSIKGKEGSPRRGIQPRGITKRRIARRYTEIDRSRAGRALARPISPSPSASFDVGVAAARTRAMGAAAPGGHAVPGIDG